MEITQNQNKAVNDIVEMVVSVIGKGSREIDTTEAISSAARLAGSFLFRSFALKINNAQPGTVVLSEIANTKGPQLVNITYAVLQSFGIEIDNSKIPGENQKEAASNFVDVIAKMQTPALEIMKAHELSYEQMAQSAAIATAFIIQQSSNISPEEGFGIAIYHYVEGSKTLPPDFATESERKADINNTASVNTTPKAISKPWWKFW